MAYSLLSYSIPMKSWKSKLSSKKRIVFFVFVFLGAISFTLANQKTDPLLNDIKNLEKLTCETFSDPNAAKYICSDAYKDANKDKDKNANKDPIIWLVPLQSPKLAELVKSTEEVKAKIEKAAIERKDLSIFKDEAHTIIDVPPLLSSLAEVSAKYLIIEKQLYRNLIRNAHEKTGNEKSIDFGIYRHLNLVLNDQVYSAIAQNDRFRILMNFWHVKDEKTGGYENLVLGVTPKELDEQEESVLKEKLAATHDEKVYAKLIHFLALRQRITNHWAVQRVSDQLQLSNPKLESCGPNILSFGREQTLSTGANGTYYDFLRKNDEFEELKLKLDSGLLETTYDAPLVGLDVEEQLIKQYFTSLPKFESAVSHVIEWSGQTSENYKKQIFSGSKIIQKNEDYWKSDARRAILASSTLGDSYYREDLADRITWIAFKQRKVSLAGQLAELAKGYAFGEDISEEQMRATATAVVDQWVTPKQKEWRAKLYPKVLAFFFTHEDMNSELRLKSQRFAHEVFDKLYPTVKVVARASEVKDEIISKKKTLCKEWQKKLRATQPLGKSCESYFKEFEMAYIPAEGSLEKRVYLWTPDQLKELFNKKLKFWAKEAEDTAVTAHSSRQKVALAKRVGELLKNKFPITMMDQFFASLSEKWNNRLKTKGKDSSNVSVDDTTLAEVLPEVVIEIYADVIKKLEESRKSPDKSGFMKVAPVVLMPTIDKMRIYQNNASPDGVVEKRVFDKGDEPHQLELFRDAMALLGFTDSTTGVHTFPLNGLYNNQRAENPRQLESLLSEEVSKIRKGPLSTHEIVNNFTPQLMFQQDKAFKPVLGPLKQAATPKNKYNENDPYDLYGQMIRSVLDQKMATEVIYEEALSRNPMLNIQVSESQIPRGWRSLLFSDIKIAPPVLDIITRDYNSVTLPDSKYNVSFHRLQAAILIAAKNIEKLNPVTEACYAHPFDRGHVGELLQWSEDEKWQHVFQTSTAFRELYKKNFSKADEALARYTRTFNDSVINDVISPVNQVVGGLMMLGLLVSVVVTVSGTGVGLVALGGGWSALANTVRLVAQGMFASGTATGSMSLFAGIFTKAALHSVAFHIINVMFFTEIFFSGYISYFKMPDQLTYRLGITNTQVGMNTSEGISRKELADFVEEIHSSRASFKTTLLWQGAFMAIPIYQEIRATRKMMGYSVKKAFGEMVNGVAKNEAYVENTPGLLRKTREQWVKEQGAVKGTWSYVNQNLKSLNQLKRFALLSEKATMEDLNALASNHFQKFVPTLEELEVIYKERIKAIQLQASRARAAAIKARLIEKNGNHYKWSERLSSWFRNSVTANLYRGEYFKVAMDKAALKIISEEMNAGEHAFVMEGIDAETGEAFSELGKVEGTKSVKPGSGSSLTPSDAEIRALCLEAYADSLSAMVGSPEELLTINIGNMNESTYLMRKILDLKIEMKAGVFDNTTPMQRFLKSFNEEDWNRHGAVAKWLVREIVKVNSPNMYKKGPAPEGDTRSFLSKISTRFSSKTKELNDFTELFSNYQKLAEEIGVMKKRAEYQQKTAQDAFAKKKRWSKKDLADLQPVESETKGANPDQHEPSSTAESETASNPEGETTGNAKDANVTASNTEEPEAAYADFEIQVTAKDGSLVWKKVKKSNKPKKQSKPKESISDGYRRYDVKVES